MQKLELIFLLKTLRKTLELGEKEDAIEIIDEVLAAETESKKSK